jgi:hypothetical protein
LVDVPQDLVESITSLVLAHMSPSLSMD